FQTGPLREIASFGSGPNAQVVDAGGRRALQYQLFHDGPGTIGFELYHLSLEQFLDRYASGFRGVAGGENRPISSEGTTLIREWQVEVAQAASLGQETPIPDDVPAGLYLLNLQAGRLNDQLLLLLTRHVVTLKQVEGEIVAWVTEINGGSVAGVTVGVYARDGEQLAEGRTDSNGIYRVEVSRDPQPLIVVARDGTDITATGLSNEWRSPGGQWWGWWQDAPAARHYAVHLYTDRPIYRPGQSVFFKGLLRNDDDAFLSLPPVGTPVTVRIRDARNNVVQSFELRTNDFGTVDGAFQLADGAMLGRYAAEVVMDAESHRQPFKVEDYRKPDYEVTVTTDARQYIEGDAITVTVDNRYFFGEPVPNAEVVIRRYGLERAYYGGEQDDASGAPTGYTWYESFLPEIRGRSDADGRTTFTFQAEMGEHAPPPYAWESSLKESTWAIEATVDDGSHQSVSGFAVVEVYNAAERPSLEHGGYFKRPGQPFTVQAEVTTLAGEPVAGRALRLEL
ncbi:MAG: MG2 domain-containing protein, partial [Ardenticatenaceae bacterium]